MRATPAIDAGGSDAGPTNGVVVLLAGGASTVLAGEFHPATGWATSTLTDATTQIPAVAVTGPTGATGVIVSNGNGGELHFTSWAPGSFSPFGAISAGLTAQQTPALAAAAGSADLIFHGLDYKHYFAVRLGALGARRRARRGHREPELRLERGRGHGAGEATPRWPSAGAIANSTIRRAPAAPGGRRTRTGSPVWAGAATATRSRAASCSRPPSRR